jgi:hypothetical protein
MTDTTVPSVPGTPFHGGFYAGRIRIGEALFALIVAPKAEGEANLKWHPKYPDVAGAKSRNDGLANTIAMSEAGSPLGKWAQALAIAGFTDWYVPSRDELELLYRHFKPTDDENNSFKDGNNPSSDPVGAEYTEAAPAQTEISAFRASGEQAFEARWYWSSTQYSPDLAWDQGFGDGLQSYYGKDGQARARAVRRFLIT